MKIENAKYTPRNTTITVRIRQDSNDNLAKFCERYKFNKSETVDLLLKWLDGSNAKGIVDDLRAIREKDMPHWQK